MLLKNDGHVLPLSRRDRSIALIGPTGDDAVFVSGGSAGVPLAARSGDHAHGWHHEPCGTGGRQRHDRAGLGG